MYGVSWLLFVLSVCFNFLLGSPIPTFDCVKCDDSLIPTAPRYIRSLEQHSTGKATTATPPNILRKRIVLGGDWDIRVFDGPAYLPIETAASVFAQFYFHIMRQAIENQLSQEAPLKHFTFRRGYLALNFFCRRSPLPWELLETIASQLLDATLKGYTGQFMAKFIHSSGMEIDLDMAVGPIWMPDASSSTSKSS